jgi:hypothetical protein
VEPKCKPIKKNISKIMKDEKPIRNVDYPGWSFEKSNGEVCDGLGAPQRPTGTTPGL